MSLLNVLLEDGRALIVTDTQYMEVTSGAYFESSKMFPLVHSNVLLASRGNQLFSLVIHEQCMGGLFAANQTYTFDTIESNLTDILARASAAFAAIPGAHLDPQNAGGLIGGIQIAIVGWSEKDQSMRGLSCIRTDINSQFSIARMESGQIAPAPTEDLSTIYCANRVEYLIQIAKAQVRQVRKEQPGYPIGGRLILADMTRDRMEIREIANLENG